MRHPLMLIALVAASAIVIGGLSVTRASMIESEARAELRSRFDHVVADLALVNDRTVAARTVEATAQECVEAEAARLGPVLAASARFSTSTVALAGATAGRATTAAASEPLVVNAGTLSVTPVQPAAGAGVEELRAALDQAGQIRADAGTAAHHAELAAAERHVACDAARRAVAEAVSEAGPRIDAVISASGLASAESVAELRAARDAVLATEGEATGADALPRWIAAASVVESTHATANAAAIAAAERAAARSASPSTGSAPRAGSSGPAPLAHPEWRVLTPEEVAALGMPPGSFIQEVPPGYYPPTGPTVG